MFEITLFNHANKTYSIIHDYEPKEMKCFGYLEIDKQIILSTNKKSTEELLEGYTAGEVTVFFFPKIYYQQVINHINKFVSDWEHGKNDLLGYGGDVYIAQHYTSNGLWIFINDVKHSFNAANMFDCLGVEFLQEKDEPILLAHLNAGEELLKAIPQPVAQFI